MVIELVRFFLVGLIGLSVIFSSTAKATSPYDSLIESVNNVSTTCMYTGSPSSKIDWTNNWYDFIQNYDASGDSNLQAAKNLLVSNVAAGKGYGVFDGGNFIDDYGFHVIVYDTDTVVPEFKDTGLPSSYTGQYTFGFQNAAILSNFYVIYFVDYGQFGYSCGDVQLTANNHMVAMAESPSGYYKHKDEGPLRPLFLADNITHPDDYEVSLFEDGSSVDTDTDGLSMIRELKQGTRDTEADSDGDGLNDFTESQWNPDRDDVFCGVSECAYPDPVKKDVYVEVDWMNDTANSRLLKPTSTQMGILTDMYDNHNVNFHADTGQYGGGNVLPSYVHTLPLASTPSVTDFEDFKDSNFASERENIWKYLIYGYEFSELPGSSGRAEVSGDDIFVSGGIVEDNPNVVSQDRAVAGTLAHEIGHTLCLSSTQVYVEQPSECVYSSIDSSTNKPLNYQSVMNYRYQLTDEDDMGVVDYSDGSHGTGDHDDWGAVMVGMSDFSGAQTALGAKVATTDKKTMDPDFIVTEAPMDYYVEKQKAAEQSAMSTDNEVGYTNAKDSMDTQNNRPKSNLEQNDGLNKEPSYPWAPFVAGGGVALVAVSGILWYVKLRKR